MRITTSSMLLLALGVVACAADDTPRGGLGPDGGDDTPVDTGSPSPNDVSDDTPADTPADDPVEAACAVDSAFRATGASFTEPTHPELAAVMNALAYGYDASPITIALRAGDAPIVAASASVENDSYQQVFVDSPEPVAATVWDGGFRSDAPQSSATLRIGDADVVIENVQLDVKTAGDCGQAWVVLDAVIPASQSDVTLDGASIESLAGASEDGWQLRALYLAESVGFDFGSM